MLSCLINSTPICLGKNYSPLPKFESEFQKMYTTQKLWKVPDPKLRNRLRRAIIDKIIPAYTRYLADDYGNAPLKFSPLNMQEICRSYSKAEFANQTKNTIRRLDESATPNKSTQLHLLVFPSVLILGWNVNIVTSQVVRL